MYIYIYILFGFVVIAVIFAFPTVVIVFVTLLARHQSDDNKTKQEKKKEKKKLRPEPFPLLITTQTLESARTRRAPQAASDDRLTPGRDFFFFFFLELSDFFSFFSLASLVPRNFLCLLLRGLRVGWWHAPQTARRGRRLVIRGMRSDDTDGGGCVFVFMCVGRRGR